MSCSRFKPWRRAGAVAVLGIVLWSSGCVTPPPTLPPGQPRRAIQPRSYKMKVAVLNFLDQTGSAGTLGETIPDVLATYLFETKRFELKERAELREVDPQRMEKIRQEYKFQVDAFLVGSITRFSVDDKLMTLDVRVINAVNGTVMYANSHNVEYAGVLDVKADRDDIQAIAEDVETAFPRLGGPDVKVTSMSGAYVTINLGRDAGAVEGMGALVIARGDTLKDPVTGEELGDEIYVGEAYIVQVEAKTSKAEVLNRIVGGKDTGLAPIVRLGDSIRFK